MGRIAPNAARDRRCLPGRLRARAQCPRCGHGPGLVFWVCYHLRATSLIYEVEALKRQNSRVARAMVKQGSNDTPVPRSEADAPVGPPLRPQVEAFIDPCPAPRTAAIGALRALIFALDATMSRQPTWDPPAALQAECFARRQRRRARRAAGLFPRAWRMPRRRLGW